MKLLVKVLRDCSRDWFLLKILWAYLHLGLHDRVVVILPVKPGHSLWVDAAVKILAIQIGAMAILVPPGAGKVHCTFSSNGQIVVAIHCGKRLTMVISKRILCSA